MPQSPAQSEALAVPLVNLYQDAEQILLARIAKALAKDIDEPHWAELKLLQIQLLQLRARAELDELGSKAAVELSKAIVLAYNRGASIAHEDLLQLVGDSVPLPPGLPAVEALVTESVGQVVSTHPGILRAVDDVYRQVIARTAPQVLLGTQTRREAAQNALDEFAKRGITGFVDKAGRRWEMSAYVEMATRSSVMRAGIQGHTDRLLANGRSLVVVSDHRQECVLCRPWEGKVLSLTGAGVRHVDVNVAGTLEEARAGGLFHPGCGHVLGVYIPGVTKVPTKTADPQGDQDRQRLRYLERQLRASRRTEAAAMSPSAKRAAQRRIRGYQAKIREHTGSTSAKRQPHRERISVGRLIDPADQTLAKQRGLTSAEIGAAKRIKAIGPHTLVSEIDLTDDQFDTFAGHVTRVLETADGNLTKPVRVVVPFGDPEFEPTSGTLGYVFQNPAASTVHIRPDIADGTRTVSTANFMPAAATEPTMAYTVAHELGHVVDNMHRDTYSWNQATFRGTDRKSAIDHHARMAATGELSGYGKGSVAEGYAEGFAQWILGGPGSTVVDEYAKEYKWTRK